MFMNSKMDNDLSNGNNSEAFYSGILFLILSAFLYVLAKTTSINYFIITIFLICLRIICMIWVSRISKRQNRDSVGWTFLAFLFPAIVLMIISKSRKLNLENEKDIKRDKRISRLAGGIPTGLILISPFFFFIYFDVIHRPMSQGRLKEYYQVPFFSLVNQSGDTVTSDDLKGYVYVTDFFFTSCQTICPKLSNRLSKMQTNYKDEQRIKFVSITVDPLRDSVTVLKKYAEQFGAVPTKWWFLTGARDSIYKLGEKGFYLSVVDTSDGERNFTHDGHLVLVDGTGMIRGYYGVLDDTTMVDSLYNNIERLLIEKPRS